VSRAKDGPEPNLVRSGDRAPDRSLHFGQKSQAPFQGQVFGFAVSEATGDVERDGGGRALRKKRYADLIVSPLGDPSLKALLSLPYVKVKLVRDRDGLGKNELCALDGDVADEAVHQCAAVVERNLASEIASRPCASTPLLHDGPSP
jgi:hypothetical protein